MDNLAAWLEATVDCQKHCVLYTKGGNFQGALVSWQLEGYSCMA